MANRPLPPDDPYLEEDLQDGWTVRGRRKSKAQPEPQEKRPEAANLFTASAAPQDDAYTDEPIPCPNRPLPPARDQTLVDISCYGRTGLMRAQKLKLFMRDARRLEDASYPPAVSDVPAREPNLSSPMYSCYRPESLRRYFGARTAFRAGRPLAEAKAENGWQFLLLATELVNGIGWRDPLDGWRQLKRLRDESAPEAGAAGAGMAFAVRSRLETWLGDFAVYYGLPEETLRETLSLKLILAARDALALSAASPADAKARCADEFLRYAEECCGLGSDRYYQDHPEDFRGVFAEALARLGSAPAGRRLLDALCMSMKEGITYIWTPFPDCAFSDPLRASHARTGYAYDIPGAFCFRAMPGSGAAGWRVTRRCLGIDRRVLLWFVRRLSELIRPARRYRFRLKPQPATPFDAAIKAALAAEDARLAALANPARSIDFSQLSRIRADAALTQAKLMVEPPEEEEAERLETSERTADAPSQSAQPAGEAPALQNEACLASGPAASLAPALQTLLLGLLAGKRGADLQALVRASGLTAAMAVDRVNEALYDAVGDAALELSTSGEPQIIEDYEEDLRALCGI